MGNPTLEAALDLMRRLPPQKTNENLQDIIDLAPELCDDLLTAADQPLKVAKCAATGKEYLLCDSNRDGDSFRSPWSNTYDPPLSDGYTPSEKLRKLEIEANKAFDIYRMMYFNGGISSVYLWDLEQGFAAAVLIKKAVTTDIANGCWDSIHIVDVKLSSGGKMAHYKMTSTVMLWVKTDSLENILFDLGGSLTRTMEKDLAVTDMNSHILNFGPMVEEIETFMRTQLNDVYFGISRNIVNTIHSTVSADQKATQKQLVADLSQVLAKQRGAIGPGH